MQAKNINVPREKIEAFCRKWKPKELSLFGSVLRDDFRPDSDIDVLVSFEEGVHWPWGGLGEMEPELEAILGRKVDLVDRNALRNPFRRHEILATREKIYAA
jgi:predicted nucleotidyltransferase